MLRIITGKAKNKHLKIPDIEGYRGVQEIARAAVFSIIGDGIKNTCCLDLYSGSGSLGIEALSREAAFCDFVDENPTAVKVIEENLFLCGFIDNYRVFRKDAIKYIYSADRTYDYIFCDPFYKNTSHTHLLKGFKRILNTKGLIFFFRDRNLDIEEQLKESGLKETSERVFGRGAFSILSK